MKLMKKLVNGLVVIYLFCGPIVLSAVLEDAGKNGSIILAKGGEKMAETLAQGLDDFGVQPAQIMAPALEKAF
jgi:hypothetical protein